MQQPPLTVTPSSASISTKPILGAMALITKIRENQRASEALRSHYTFHDVETIEDLDPHGKVTKTETVEHEDEFIQDIEAERVVKRNGRPLNEEEQRKEDEHVKKFVERVKEQRDKHEDDDSAVGIMHLAELATMTNPRRVQLNGRDTIVYDYSGKQKAHADGTAENVLKRISGELWVDEKDLQVVRVTAHFDENFHIGGGLLANVQKGSEFILNQTLVRNEVWLPAEAEVRLDARVLLVKGIRQHITLKYSDYRKYQTDVTFMNTVPVVQNDQTQ